MRPLEIVALSLLGLALLLFLVPAAKRPEWARWAPAASAVGLAGQFLLEGYRSQLDLAYPLCAALLIASWASSRVKFHHAIVATLAVLGVVWLAFVVAIAIGSPMFELPEPTGAYAIGVTSLYVEDPAREETYTPEPDDHRELMVRVWYPAEDVSASHRPVPYWEDARQAGRHMARIATHVFGITLRENSFDHYAAIPTHSYANAPVATGAGKMPVLVFSHGYGIARPQSNTALMEELASRGYWVASVGHTYETPAVVFEDGRVIAWSVEAVVGLFSGQNEAFFESFVRTEDPASRDDLVRDFLAAETYTSSSMKVWNADTHTLVDEIERIASGARPTPFAGRLDVERLGVLGMSFGGAAAGVFCVEDPRCKVGLNLDGFHYGDGMADAVISVPFMILAAKRAEIPINEFFYRHAAGPVYLAKVDGSTHMNFTDTSISSVMLRWLGALGPIDGQRMLHIMNAYTSAFLDHHLLGKPSPLLESNSADYPDVELMSRNTEAL